MADMERDRKNDYLHKDINGQWNIELPRIGNADFHLPLAIYSGGRTSLPELRRLATAIRRGVESYRRDLLKVQKKTAQTKKSTVAPAPKPAPVLKEPVTASESVGRLRKKVERLVLGATAYSQHVMESAREYALSAIEIEKPDRPYRAKIEGGVLPPMPRGDVSFGVARNEFEGVSGIYFLHREHTLVYVGMSENIGARIKQHQHATESDRVCVVEVPEDKLKQAEDHYIWSLRPPLNKEWKYSYEDGEFSGSPLARFVTEKQPQPTAENSVPIAIPLPHSTKTDSTVVSFSPAVNAAARTEEVKEKAEHLCQEIALCVLEEPGQPEQQVQQLIDAACSALQNKAEEIRLAVKWAKGGVSDAPESEGAA